MLNSTQEGRRTPRRLSGELPGRGAVSIHQGCRLFPTQSTHLHQLPGKDFSHRLGLGLG